MKAIRGNMKLLKSSRAAMTLEVIELPRQNWRYVPPSKVAIIATLCVIVVTAVLWSVL